MAVHAVHQGGDKFKIHAVGSGVKGIKPGDSVRSSDLDDLSSEGHKVKEIKKMKEEIEVLDEKMTDVQKKGIQTALGPKDSKNPMRKTSKPARIFIDLVKKQGMK